MRWRSHAVASLYGILQGAWPVWMVEAIWDSLAKACNPMTHIAAI
jgi:hypothetical protein